MKKMAVLCCAVIVLTLTVSTVPAFAQGILYFEFVENLTALVQDEPNLPAFDSSSDAMSTGDRGMIFIGNNVQLVLSFDSGKAIETIKFIGFPSGETTPPLLEAYHAIICVVGALIGEDNEETTGDFLLKETFIASLLYGPIIMQETIEIGGYTLGFSYYGDNGPVVDIVAK